MASAVLGNFGRLQVRVPVNVKAADHRQTTCRVEVGPVGLAPMRGGGVLDQLRIWGEERHEQVQLVAEPSHPVVQFFQVVLPQTACNTTPTVEIYSDAFQGVKEMINRFILVASLVAAGSLSWGQAAAQSPNESIRPATADDSCEFGYKLSGYDLWVRNDFNRHWDEWVNFSLGKAIQYCKNGDRLMLGRGGANAQGDGHSFFTVAALLCRRPEIQETKKPPLQSNQQAVIEFRCTITKIDALNAKAARGEPLFRWPDDFVEPRPGDNVPRPGESQGGFNASPSRPNADCKDTKSPSYAERCGISIATPPKN